MHRLIAITIGVVVLLTAGLLWAFPGAREYVWSSSLAEMDAAQRWMYLRWAMVMAIVVVGGAIAMRPYLMLTASRGVRPRGMGGANAIVQIAFLVLSIPLGVVLPMTWPWWLMMGVSYALAAGIAALANPFVLSEIDAQGTIRPVRTGRRVIACLIAAAVGLTLQLTLPAWQPVQWT